MAYILVAAEGEKPNVRHLKVLRIGGNIDDYLLWGQSVFAKWRGDAY